MRVHSIEGIMPTESISSEEQRTKSDKYRGQRGLEKAFLKKVEDKQRLEEVNGEPDTDGGV